MWKSLAPGKPERASSVGHRAAAKEAMTTLRRIILILVLIFIIYSIVVNPTQAALDVRAGIGALAAGVGRIFTFFGALGARG
jgi:hypothetical protein